MFERASAVLRHPRKLLKQVGVLGMSSAVRRLTQELKMNDDGARTGRLMSSIRSGLSGTGGGDTVFNLSDEMVEVGTNVPYAKQLQDPVVIFPSEKKALAIPLPKSLKLSGQSPSDLDKNREILQFMPYSGTRPNVMGLLIDPEGQLGYGAGPLYALAYYVIQKPRPFLFWDENDKRVIHEELWPRFLGVA